ncbi:hypothetical protein RhiirC2_776924 [Rhizophagus irregularis]|uniref:Uncharacterized protein n=1 Tax=Rhizophagus irregularis TaxID=588596 RepID=A0A2N1NFI0_9GLOM|nr:hypothetical protein RhiirC2_776924 [Rhizophagus irregularis]
MKSKEIRTENEWKNNAISQVGSNRFSSISRLSARTEYDDETEMYWVEFTAIFDQRRKKGNRSPTQMYNILSDEIGLSSGTLASFYHLFHGELGTLGFFSQSQNESKKDYDG